jgi:hypothetical protein
VCTDDLGIRKRDSVNIVALRTSELRMDIVTKNFTAVQFDFFLCVYSFTPPTCSIFYHKSLAASIPASTRRRGADTTGPDAVMWADGTALQRRGRSVSHACRPTRPELPHAQDLVTCRDEKASRPGGAACLLFLWHEFHLILTSSLLWCLFH